ncbi:MAG TPA: methyltransferase domain-containing protein, partial [Kofleriaceae bacterium]|nr:methyltransferase domain-containing protein [Kofleriaceae bacterium]
MDWHEPTEWPADARRDRLIGDWHLHQRRGGHRTSTDDLVTAWFATSRTAGAPARYLDLGCGIGSVLLMTAHRLRPGASLGLEAQPQSVLMARRSIAELPPGAPPIEVACSDFRSWDPAGREFELITGSPPYFPLSAGVLPADAQRRGCRFEARGGIEAYCTTAASVLAPRGRFYIVFQTAGDERVLAAAAAAGLALHGRVDLHMRA